MIKSKPIEIKINQTSIDYSFWMYYIQEENGMFSWYLPGYDISFSTNDYETGEKRAEAMIVSFFQFWLEDKGFQSFVLELRRLGFFPTKEGRQLNPQTIYSQLLKGIKATANFKPISDPSIPASFIGSIPIIKNNIYAQAQP